MLDADKEGFLRTPGLPHLDHRPRRPPPRRPCHPLRRQDDRLHAARYRRNQPSREKQEFYNTENGIEPRTVIRAINDSLATILKAEYADLTDELSPTAEEVTFNTQAELDTYIARLETECANPPKNSNSNAATFRDTIKDVRTKDFSVFLEL